jgi:hypothetical protein
MDPGSLDPFLRKDLDKLRTDREAQDLLSREMRERQLRDEQRRLDRRKYLANLAGSDLSELLSPDTHQMCEDFMRIMRTARYPKATLIGPETYTAIGHRAEQNTLKRVLRTVISGEAPTWQAYCIGEAVEQESNHTRIDVYLASDLRYTSALRLRSKEGGAIPPGFKLFVGQKFQRSEFTRDDSSSGGFNTTWTDWRSMSLGELFAEIIRDAGLLNRLA